MTEPNILEALVLAKLRDKPLRPITEEVRNLVEACITGPDGVATRALLATLESDDYEARALAAQLCLLETATDREHLWTMLAAGQDLTPQTAAATLAAILSDLIDWVSMVALLDLMKRPLHDVLAAALNLRIRSDSSGWVRACAAATSGLTDSEDESMLIRLLRAESSAIAAAGAAVGLIGNPDALPHLLRSASSDPDFRVRAAADLAANYNLSLSEEAEMDPLGPGGALHDIDPSVRAAGVRSAVIRMSTSSEEDVVDGHRRRLLMLLDHDPSPDVQVAVCMTLGAVPDSGAEAHLVHALEQHPDLASRLAPARAFLTAGAVAAVDAALARVREP